MLIKINDKLIISSTLIKRIQILPSDDCDGEHNWDIVLSLYTTIDEDFTYI